MSRLKFRMRLKLATDSMVMRIHNLIGNVLLCMVSLLLVALMLLMNELNSNQRVRLEQCFREGCGKIGYAICNTITEDLYSRDFLRFLQTMECIDAVGTWGIYGNTNDFMHVLQQVQKKNVIYEGNATDESIECLLVTDTAWDMFNIELAEGAPPEKFDLDVYAPVYLGHEFQDVIEVGTILGNDGSNTNIVAGILKEGTLMPAEGLDSMNKFTISSAYPMDYAVLEVVTIPLNSVMYFSPKEGYSFAEAQEMIQQKAEERGWSVTVGSVDAGLLSIERAMEPVNRYMMQMILVVGLTACIVFTCYQTMSIIVRKSEYGILYANGATTRDLIAVILIENAVKILISMIILFPLFILLAQNIFSMFYGDQYMIQWIIWEKVSWKLLLVGGMMTIFSSILPVYILKQYTPVTLIGGNRT